MPAKELHQLVEQQKAMVVAEQTRVLKRLQEGGLVDLFVQVATEIAQYHPDVRVKLSKPTDNPYDIPTVSLVCDGGKRRLSAYEVIIAPGGVKGFRIRLGYDHWDRNCGAALIPDGNEYFDGQYGDSNSLEVARRILMDGSNPHKYGVFAGGTTDITPNSRADRLLKQVILRKPGPHPEAPGEVIFQRHNPGSRKVA